LFPHIAFHRSGLLYHEEGATSPMITDEIQATIQAIAHNAAVYAEIHFVSRAEALDELEFHVLDRIAGLAQTADLIRLSQAAARVKRDLEAIDGALFQRLRSAIRTGVCNGTALKDLIEHYVGQPSDSRRLDQIGYDILDQFINGLLGLQTLPDETQALEQEMVAYQQTPARVIVELIAQADLTQDDVFYDVGSGLGHVPLLVSLLSDATAKGIEWEGAYCAAARACARNLNLARVAFVHADARTADYTDGTVFFLYTPFRGRILHAVLEKLRTESRRRRIRIFTYGPCTLQVAQQRWLKDVGQAGNYSNKLATWSSL